MEILVGGAPYSIEAQTRATMKSMIAIPKDLCDGERVKVIKTLLPQFKSKFTDVVNTLQEETQVLVVIIDSSDEVANLVKICIQAQYIHIRTVSSKHLFSFVTFDSFLAVIGRK